MSAFKRLVKRLGLVAAVSGMGAVFLLEALPKINEARRTKASHCLQNLALLNRPKLSAAEIERFNKPLPSRMEHLSRMSSGEIFDVLVIGGGATGTGVAVDAASR
ncbi:hypothetical protein X801_06587, partial [Opisthorchis viverrini]